MNKWFYFGGLILGVVLLVLLVSKSIEYGRIDSWLERAKDAGNPAQVAEFLLEYQAALEDKGLVADRYYSIWKYPATKMGIYIRVIDGLVVRATDLSNQTSTDESYQMGLINLEKDLGDVDARAFSVWFASGGWVVGILVSILSLWAMLGWIPLTMSD